MSILSLLLGLFGCGGNKKYTIDDIVLVHTGYYGMESNPVYSFAMRKEEDNWVFSASCRVGSNKDHYTSFSSFPITDEDAQGFLQIIREDGEIERLFKYRNPIRIFHISDAPARSFGMTFSDGNSIEKKTKPGDRALDYLYALADRHYKSAESVEVTAVSIHRNCMDYSSSCSFCLEKNEGVWLFSFSVNHTLCCQYPRCMAFIETIHYFPNLHTSTPFMSCFEQLFTVNTSQKIPRFSRKI